MFFLPERINHCVYMHNQHSPRRLAVVALHLACIVVFATGCASLAPLPDTDIYLADLDAATMTLSNVRNITQRRGYDNQPAFSANDSVLYYVASVSNAPTDVFRYTIATGERTRITTTAEAEFSPTPMNDGKSLSVVRVGKPGAADEEYTESQQLWRYTLDGRPIAPIIGARRVGYHCWVSDGTVALFIVGNDHTRTPHTLVAADLASRQTTLVASSIGRTIRISPGGALTYVDTSDSTRSVVTAIAPNNETTKPLLQLPGGTEDFAWLPDGRILVSNGTEFLYWDGTISSSLRPIQAPQLPTGKIGRIVVSHGGRVVAFVVTK